MCLKRQKMFKGAEFWSNIHEFWKPRQRSGEAVEMIRSTVDDLMMDESRSRGIYSRYQCEARLLFNRTRVYLSSLKLIKSIKISHYPSPPSSISNHLNGPNTSRICFKSHLRFFSFKETENTNLQLQKRKKWKKGDWKLIEIIIYTHVFIRQRHLEHHIATLQTSVGVKMIQGLFQLTKGFNDSFYTIQNPALKHKRQQLKKKSVLNNTRTFICVRTPGSEPAVCSWSCAAYCCNSPAGLRSAADGDCADTVKICSRARSGAGGRNSARGQRERFWKRHRPKEDVMTFYFFLFMTKMNSRTLTLINSQTTITNKHHSVLGLCN